MSEYLLDSQNKENYWNTVTSCLVLLFEIEKEQAVELTLNLMMRIEKPDHGNPNELFYHAEPFDVAKDLAQKPNVRFQDYQEGYEEIVRAIENKTLDLA